MFKKLMVTILIVGVLGASKSIVYASNTAFNIKINGQDYVIKKGEPQPYFNQDNRTMVPVRFISNALGVVGENVMWDQSTKTVIILANQKVIGITLGTDSIRVGSEVIKMDTKAEEKNGRVFVPARYIVEALGGTVEWDQSTNTVLINYEKKKPDDTAYDDTVFDEKKNPNLLDMVSAENFDVVNGEFRWKIANLNGDGYRLENYRLSEKVNPELNKRVYELVKNLIDKDHFVEVFYDDDKELGKRVVIKYAPNRVAAYAFTLHFTLVIFEDKSLITFSPMYLKDPFSFSDKAYDPFYKEKMDKVFMNLYGEVGKKISDFTLKYDLEDYDYNKNVEVSQKYSSYTVRFIKPKHTAVGSFEITK